MDEYERKWRGCIEEDTLVNALIGLRKTPPAQVAGDVHSKCK